MGLLNFIRNNFTLENYTPDFTLSEYDNWMIFLGEWGTSEQWEDLKKRKHWKFPKDDTEIFIRYQEELKPISDKYYSIMEKMQKDWSALYNLGDYTGKLAVEIEQECIEDIMLYKKMKEIDSKYSKETPTNIPAFKRLAMLYERQGNFEQAVDICKKAYGFGVDERGRMLRIIKKAGRTPKEDELNLINN